MAERSARRPLRVAIVDDERPARQRLRDLLARSSDIEVVGEAADGGSAVSLLRETRADLVFLDVQMPGNDGFAVLAEVPPERRPQVVFVTAYDRYALRAFDEHALDYLLKPFSDERFAETLERGRRSTERGRDASRLEALLDSVAEGRTAPTAERNAPFEHLVARRRGELTLVPVERIDWLEAAGTYTRVHAGERPFLYRETLGRLAECLDSRCFVRIHRSTVVRLDRIARLLPRSHGEYDVVLTDGTRRRLSRTYRPLVEERLGQRL